MSNEALPAFSAVGIELEYMIVDRDSLAVRPISDVVLRDDEGQVRGDIDRGETGWSNEVTAHVVELKNPRPTVDLVALHAAFAADIAELDRALAVHHARLMPTAMHPWMNPLTETRLWPHDHAELYRAFDRIFDCRQHGWANLQSMHINLPFRDDDEFARLHAAARLALPLLPALAASSPIIDGAHHDWMDTRMAVYREHERRIPALLGDIVPDTFISEDDYRKRMLAPMYRDIAAHDPKGVLGHEWINAHGLIARFDRHALEIRVVDMQECPAADLAIASAAIALIKALYTQPPTSLEHQQAISTQSLAHILDQTSREADSAVVDVADYLAALGSDAHPKNARELWQRFLEAHADRLQPWRAPLACILQQGPLSRRILRALNGDFSRTRLADVYRNLCDCLAQGRMFHAG